MRHEHVTRNGGRRHRFLSTETRKKQALMNSVNRRAFLSTSAVATAGAAVASCSSASVAAGGSAGMQFGLVTYLWGKDFALPALIKLCEKAGVQGVETRTQHKHGVEPELSKTARREVKRRFADSPVTLVGYGSNAQFHDADPKKVAANIELAKQYVRLMHDCGGSGVKVKPNGFPAGVPREKTIEQIGKSLNVVAEYAMNYGQQIRVEAHGRGTQELEVMKAIFAVADHKNATICWNSNPVDFAGKGLEHNFNLVKDRFGDTVHIHELGSGKYPYAAFFKLLAGIKYKGWILLEAGGNPADKVAALIQQRNLFEQLTA